MLSAAWLPVILLFPTTGALIAALAHQNGITRLAPVRLGSWLAILPFAAFTGLLLLLPAVQYSPLVWQAAWLPELGLVVGFYLDHLAVLFALLVTGAGALVVIYSGSYFRDDPGAWRFFAYLFLFMTAMLGLVLAADVITLFVFWEATSLTSFLLVGYKFNDPAARQGALRALLITGGGGAALLLGLLVIGSAAGFTFQEILLSGEALRSSPLYPVALGLVALGALTKSAQFPFHLWLPGAMKAPTPASAYLHSATMVKAGIYLLMRLNPVLGGTELWFWLFTSAGLMTMLAGAYLGFKQNDLKALLAYSTIAQLGALVMLVGQDTDLAFKALVIGVPAHALYKSALFLVVGGIDQSAGTRELSKLGGLSRALPHSWTIAAGLAALSMAGLPPLFGFLAKETLLASAVHPSLPTEMTIVLAAGVVVAGAFLLAQAGLFFIDGFVGKPRDYNVYSRIARSKTLTRASGWLPPLVPALFSFLLGLGPEPPDLARFLAAAAGEAYGGTVKVSLALWNGLNLPLGLSILAISLGTVLFVFRRPARAWQQSFAPRLALVPVYVTGAGLVERAAVWTAGLQNGKLRAYLATIVSAMAGLVLAWLASQPGGVYTFMAGFRFPPELDGQLTLSNVRDVLRLSALLTAIGAGLAGILLRRDLFAVLSLTAMGLSVAIFMALEPAPDVALVQIVVDVLSTVILALALTRLPRAQRRRAAKVTFRQSRPGLMRDLAVSAAGGLLVAGLAWQALVDRPRASLVSPYYLENAKFMTGARDVVGAIVVDFRAMDTLLEITVFALAGMGVYRLLRRLHGEKALNAGAHAPVPLAPSPLLVALAQFALPFSLVLAVVQILYGHDQPGDGFTAGVIVGLAIAFWYLVFGYEQVRSRLAWLRPAGLISTGFGAAAAAGLSGWFVNRSYFSPVDFNQWLGLPLPAGFNLNTALLFEAAIALVVVGGAAYIIDSLGIPGQVEAEDVLEDTSAGADGLHPAAGLPGSGAPAVEMETSTAVQAKEKTA